MNAFLEGEDKALLTVVEACVVVAPMTVENVASMAVLLGMMARHGGKVADFERLLRQHLGDERYEAMYQEMAEVVKQYINNRTVQIGDGKQWLSP
jgi:hypothetical protein